MQDPEKWMLCDWKGVFREMYSFTDGLSCMSVCARLATCQVRSTSSCSTMRSLARERALRQILHPRAASASLVALASWPRSPRPCLQA